MTVESLRTPAVLIDKRKALRNLDLMQEKANARGVRLRPHTKTHKSPLIAQWQLDRGAAGICCAKLGEAEVFATAGFKDIRLPYPINPANADRVVALLNRTRLSFIVDHPAVAQQWSDAMMLRGKQVDVLVKVDDIIETGANDVYVVHGPRGEILVPAIKSVVKQIDPDNGRMLIEPLPGLLP